MRVLVTILMMFAFCCSSARLSADAHVRGGLDVLALVVDPLYRKTMEGCIARETLFVERAEAKTLPVDDATREVEAVRAVCHRQRKTFEAIRALHEEAVRQVEAGSIEQAEEALERVRAALAELKGDPT